MTQRLVYHWKHGWIPLDHYAALQKAHGRESGARLLEKRLGLQAGDGKSTHLEQHLRDHQPPPGYQVTEGVVHEGTPFAMSTGHYSFVDPSGQRHHVGGSKKVATRRAHDHAAREAEKEAERQKKLAAQRSEQAKRAAFDAELAKSSQVQHIDLADYRKRQNLRDRNRFQRINGGKTPLSGDELAGILVDPDASDGDKQRARSDLEDLGYTEAKSRLSRVPDDKLSEALLRIEASDWPQWLKDGARRVISQRRSGAK